MPATASIYPMLPRLRHLAAPSIDTTGARHYIVARHRKTRTTCASSCKPMKNLGFMPIEASCRFPLIAMPPGRDSATALENHWEHLG